MARIEISSVSNPYGTGELQLQGKVAMSGTLTAVTDNLNNASPLKLSTGGVQVASTLQITTNSNPYIDAEDGAGNNRFQVGRDPSSQVVNVDFASNPTGGTNYVGAIRTYVDGVNLGDVVSFRKDAFVYFKGQTFYNAVKNADSGSDYFWNDINPNITAGANNQVVSLVRLRDRGVSNTGGFTATQRLGLIMENGGGGQFPFQLFSDTGALRIGFNSVATPTAKVHIQGSGSTSATTSLLVQNSGGSNALQVTDDKNAQVFGSDGGGLTIGGAVGGESYYVNINTSLPGTGNRGGIKWGSLAEITNVRKYFGANDSTISFINSGIELITIQGRTSAGLYTNNVGINNTSPDGSAILDVASTTQGFLPPRMTTIEKNAIVTPAIGLMVFDTTLGRPCFYNGIWVTL